MKNATIIYLVGSTEESFEEIKESLNLLKFNFLDDYPYPVNIFIEEDFLEVWKEDLLKIYYNIRFPKVKFEIPESNLNLNIPDLYPHPTHGKGPIAWGHPGFTLGYRHMCRFMAGEMFKHPDLIQYDWYWRLDSDSYVQSRVGFDVFEKMDSNNYLYGFNNIQDDNPKVIEGLFEFSRNYFENLGIKEKNQVHYPKIYYTNFEIANIKWYLSSGYLEYFNSIDKNGGIFTGRWGDAPIRYIGVRTLMRPENIFNFEGIINYRHGKVRNIEKNLRYND